MREPMIAAAASARRMSSGTIGMSGTTSAAPTRGWAPSCVRRSIRSTAILMPASSASASSASDPTSGEHRAVVVGIGVDVEQPRVHREGGPDRVHDRPVATLAEVRDGLEWQHVRTLGRAWISTTTTGRPSTTTGTSGEGSSRDAIALAGTAELAQVAETIEALSPGPNA